MVDEEELGDLGGRSEEEGTSCVEVQREKRDFEGTTPRTR